MRLNKDKLLQVQFKNPNQFLNKCQKNSFSFSRKLYKIETEVHSEGKTIVLFVFPIPQESRTDEVFQWSGPCFTSTRRLTARHMSVWTSGYGRSSKFSLEERGVRHVGQSPCPESARDCPWARQITWKWWMHPVVATASMCAIGC